MCQLVHSSIVRYVSRGKTIKAVDGLEHHLVCSCNRIRPHPYALQSDQVILTIELNGLSIRAYVWFMHKNRHIWTSLWYQLTIPPQMEQDKINWESHTQHFVSSLSKWSRSITIRLCITWPKHPDNYSVTFAKAQDVWKYIIEQEYREMVYLRGLVLEVT